MENHILYCYKEWLKERDGSILKQISKLTVWAIIFLTLLLGALIAFFVILGYSIGGNDVSIAAWICSAVYVVLCIIISIYFESYQVKHSKQSLEKYKEYCDDMMKKVIMEHGFSENFIPILINRYNTIINVIEEKIKLKHERFNKFFEMLLIPISVIILGALLDKGIDATETIGLGLSGTLVILMIYAIAFFFLYLYDFVMRLSQGKYREFVTDLQSILDFKECKNTNKSDVAMVEPLTEVAPESSAVIT